MLTRTSLRIADAARAVVLIALGSLIIESRADFLLDDFSSTVASQSFPIDHTSLGVGDAGASRRTTLSLGRGGELLVAGNFDVNTSQAGAFSIYHTQVPPTGTPIFPNATASWQIRLECNFTAIDVTQGGVNDLILFDFVGFQGPYRPSFIQVLIRDELTIAPGYSAGGSLLVLQEAVGPISVAFPVLQSGFSTSFRPDRINHIEIFFTYSGIPTTTEDFGFQLDAIRFGVIPEPTTFGVALSGLLSAALRCRWRS